MLCRCLSKVATVDENFAKKEKESIVEVERGEKREREREKEGREEKALKSLFLNDEGKFLFSILF